MGLGAQLRCRQLLVAQSVTAPLYLLLWQPASAGPPSSICASGLHADPASWREGSHLSRLCSGPCGGYRTQGTLYRHMANFGFILISETQAGPGFPSEPKCNTNSPQREPGEQLKCREKHPHICLQDVHVTRSEDAHHGYAGPRDQPP